MIRVDGLGARAGAFALRDVSFELPAGTWGIVLGPAGAGKTTLLETIAGVRRADAGRVTLRGADVTRTPPEQRGVGIVPRSRTRLRRELRSMQWEQSLTVLHVTHDFGEAGTLGDLAILLEGGRLLQAAPPETLFRRPPSAAAAEFLGAENVFAGTATPMESATGDEPGVMLFRAGSLALVGIGDSRLATHAVIRGEDVVLSLERPGPSSARNAIAGVVAEIVVHGALARVTVDLGDLPLVATVTAGSVSELGLLPGSRVVATIKATAVHLC
ncbi:MAG: TOBE domain-containing protein [Gemmatimonadetes bacterium]|nr:TOBE domain-containing protein [Gemmatimonadota bacterium]